jgi:hypothetical protein
MTKLDNSIVWFWELIKDQMRQRILNTPLKLVSANRF